MAATLFHAVNGRMARIYSTINNQNLFDLSDCCVMVGEEGLEPSKP
jgi:hypothetical protein